jgi:hypothetical protein
MEVFLRILGVCQCGEIMCSRQRGRCGYSRSPSPPPLLPWRCRCLARGRGGRLRQRGRRAAAGLGASAAPRAPGRQGPHPSTRLLRIRIRYERIDTKKRNEETLRRQDLSRDSATSPLRYPSALLLPSLSSFQDVDWIVPPTSRSRSRRGFQDSKTHQRSYDPTMPAGLSSPMTSLQFVIY